MHTKLPLPHCRSQDKKGSYIAIESEQERDEAKARFVDAMNQVTFTVRKGRCNQNAVHYYSGGQRAMKTLYVGNLDYNADSKLSLHKTR